MRINMNPLTKMLMAVVLCSPAAATEKNGALLELLKALNANGTIDDKTYGLIESLAEQETRDNSRQEVHLDEFKDEHSIEQIVNEKIALVKNELKPQVRLGSHSGRFCCLPRRLRNPQCRH